jgi:hypothetical protein
MAVPLAVPHAVPYPNEATAAAVAMDARQLLKELISMPAPYVKGCVKWTGRRC